MQGKGIYGSKFQVNLFGIYWITNGMSGNPHTYLNLYKWEVYCWKQSLDIATEKTGAVAIAYYYIAINMWGSIIVNVIIKMFKCITLKIKSRKLLLYSI